MAEAERLKMQAEILKLQAEAGADREQIMMERAAALKNQVKNDRTRIHVWTSWD